MGEEVKNKIAIVIICYNISSKIFILQIEAIKSFCKDEDYTIEIFDNGNIPEMSEHIRYHAEQFGVNYTKTYSADQNSSTSHSFAAGLAYNKLKGIYSYFLFLDHDCIPKKVFSVASLLEGKIMGGLGQWDSQYFWPGLFCFDNTRVDKDLIDFWPVHEKRFDTGGNLYKAIEKHGKENCIFFNEAYVENHGFGGYKYAYFSLLCNEIFIHMTNGSQWNSEDRHEERVNSFINFVKEKAGL